MQNEPNLLDALLDSWDRNNTILTNLVLALPEGALELRPMAGSPAVGQLITHMHYCRLVFVQENVPELAQPVIGEEWRKERDPARLAQLLRESSLAVRGAFLARYQEGRPMDRHYDHPILLLQHMLWHEGYHHGQIKLTLKLAGRAFEDEEIGAVTWDVWMDKH
jgi:uncharacterized damage-inducible protein DinB